MDLTQQKCVPCEGGVEAMTRDDALSMISYHVKDWVLDESATHISKKFIFANFREALSFVNKVGVIAEQEGHHPDIHLVDYKYVEIALSTHAIGGLSQNDFIVAAKINIL